MIVYNSHNVLLNGTTLITTKLSHGGYDSVFPKINHCLKDADEIKLSKQGKLGYLCPQAFEGKVIQSNDIYSFGGVSSFLREEKYHFRLCVIRNIVYKNLSEFLIILTKWIWTIRDAIIKC